MNRFRAFAAGSAWLLTTVPGADGSARAAPLPPPAWTVESNQIGARLGWAVAAGDVDGDGFADVLLGAATWDAAQADEGAAVLFDGSAAGPARVPSWSGTSGQAGAQLGSAVAVGDLDGDGCDDVVAGVPGWTGGQAGEGAAFLWLGAPGGPAAGPDRKLEGSRAGMGFGAAVATAGDVNGDGLDDLIVGAPWDDAGRGDEGRAFLFLGSAAGLQVPAAWVGTGQVAGGQLGKAVASAGDVDGDGFADVIVGAPVDGSAEVYLGGAAGLAAAPAWTARGDQPDASFGWAVASAGDVDGDGFDDVVVGAYTEDPGGAVFLYGGASSGPSAAPTWSATSTVRQHGLGHAVVSAGDLDGNGYADLAVGSADDQRGGVDVFLGGPAGLSAAPAASGDLAQQAAYYGWALASGDTDGDGLADLMVGADQDTDGEDSEGAAFLYLGAPLPDTDGDGVSDVVDVCPATPDPAQADTDGDGLGDACDAPTLAVEGVVSPGATVTLVATGLVPGESARFGGAVGGPAVGPCPAALGRLCLDLGPGAVDLGTAVADASGRAARTMVVPAGIVPNGTYTVQAAVARGPGGADSAKSSPFVLAGTRLDWDADGLVDADELALGTDPTLADTDGDGLGDAAERAPWTDPLVADTDGDGVPDGSDVCFAGDDGPDADTDGVPDACDLCPLDADPTQGDADGDGLGDACEGAVLGGPWTAEADQDQASFGEAVAAADVNGDGFDDLVVGAPGFSDGQADEGELAVYFGSAAGLAAVPSQVEESNSAGAEWTTVVASAGDVDGDGFDDIVVGSPFWGKQRVGVYLGSPTGLATLPVWSVVAATQGYGASLASAGDVNGDGYDDLLVGDAGDLWTAQAGGAWLYLGSPTGPAVASAWSFSVPDGYDAHVASAGDVDGDGFADVLVGLDRWSDPYTPVRCGALLFRGSAAGLGPIPAWTAREAAPCLAPRVASAGDVNGDGRPDVAIAWWDATEVYFGSPWGLEASPRWTGPGAANEAVTGAGDVDGDGYGDLLVGDAYTVPGGEAALYLGSAWGPAAVPAWTFASGQGQGMPPALFGSALAAGDLNGDGFADVAVGAPGYDHGQANEGRVYTWLGQAP